MFRDRKYFETERDIFCVGDECVVYQMRIADNKEEAYKLLEKYMRCVWKDPQLIAQLMEKQETFLLDFEYPHGSKYDDSCFSNN